MNRRQWLTMFACGLAVLALVASHATRRNRVQRRLAGAGRGSASLPGRTPSKGRIAPVSEPGVPLLVFEAPCFAPTAGLRSQARWSSRITPIGTACTTSVRLHTPGVCAARCGRRATGRSNSRRSVRPRTRRRASRSTFMWRCRRRRATITPVNGVLPTIPWSTGRAFRSTGRARSRMDTAGQRSTARRPRSTSSRSEQPPPDCAFS